MKQTKIVCTIGPASHTKTKIAQMIGAGMNVARLNFSHGDYASHAKLIAEIRAAAKAKGAHVALLQDVQGPRIRIGNVAKEGVLLKNRDAVVLLSQEAFDSAHHGEGADIALPVQYHNLYKDVSAGATILIQDGTIELCVERVTSASIHCHVVQGGRVFSHKGINTPGSTISTSVITEKDKLDVAFGIEQCVDYIALSFVKDPADIRHLRRLIPELSQIKVVAKIERQEAVDAFDEIVSEADAIMVARGDLGVELGPEKVPLLQKKMILQCLQANVPVIVATQMLESMVSNPRPTRAEAADVANAILDHADAVMLSAESATGAFPVEAVRTMTSIAEEVEISPFARLSRDVIQAFDLTQQQGIADAAVTLAVGTHAAAIVVLVRTGKTARLISQLRPQHVRIIACTHDEQVLRQMALVWGVYSLHIEQPRDMQSLVRSLRHHLPKQHFAKKGDSIVIVAGHGARFENAEKGFKSVETVVL